MGWLEAAHERHRCRRSRNSLFAKFRLNSKRSKAHRETLPRLRSLVEMAPWVQRSSVPLKKYSLLSTAGCGWMSPVLGGTGDAQFYNRNAWLRSRHRLHLGCRVSFSSKSAGGIRCAGPHDGLKREVACSGDGSGGRSWLGRVRAEGEEVSSETPPDERVIYRERFQGVYFDFRGKSIFARYDRCEFVKCTLLIDHATEQLAFTACVFKDCNIDKLEPDEERGLYVRDNFFDRPLNERRAEYEVRLAQALAGRKAKGK
jgi:hypothetical protein